jgi:putative transferase (TIGR04331 family)
MYLVTTGFDKPINIVEDEVLLLGAWCKPFYDSVAENKKFKTVPYHWKDRGKLKKDYDYLRAYYEKVLICLSEILNQYHNVDYSIRYWRTLVGPWLLTYVPLVWDRWENVRIAIESYNVTNSIIAPAEIVDLIPYDYQSSHDQFTRDHLWNYLLFSRIIAYAYPEIGGYRDEDVICYGEAISSLSVLSWKKKLMYFVDQMVGSVDLCHDILIFEGSFSKKAYIDLCFRLGQIPRLYNDFYQDIVYPLPDHNMRRMLSLDYDPDNHYEQFIGSIIFNHIPVAYLEGYKKLVDKAFMIKYDPKVVFTSTAHFSNELFKVWVAHKVSSKLIKLVIAQHGGGLPPKYSMFDHEEDIADIKTVWHIPYMNKQIQLPAQKIIGRKVKQTKPLWISLIGVEMPPYSYRCQASPMSSLVLCDYEQKISLIENLSPESYGYLKIRAYPDRGWGLREQYIERYGEHILDSNIDIYDTFSVSKIIICSYPQTTFSEAMNSDVPVIMLYINEYWEVDDNFTDLVSELRAASIIFTSPQKAASHINSVSGDVRAWWGHPQTIKARTRYLDACAPVMNGSVRHWSSFFKSIV